MAEVPGVLGVTGSWTHALHQWGQRAAPSPAPPGGDPAMGFQIGVFKRKCKSALLYEICFLSLCFWMFILKMPVSLDIALSSRSSRNDGNVCSYAPQWGFPGGSVSDEDSPCQRKRRKSDPWVGKILWRSAWQPTPVFLLGKSHGQTSLAGYSPWGHKESNTTWQLNYNKTTSRM